MSPTRRRAVMALMSAAAAGPCWRPGRAETPLRIVVPFPPGGPTDAVARIVAEGLRGRLARPVLVENKPGAAGTIGVRHVLAAPADGTTWLVGNNQTHATAPFLVKDAGYDPLRDFTAVSGLADMHHVLVVRPDLAVEGMAGFLAHARANPSKLTYGSTGIGSGSHLAMELLMARTSVTLRHIPFQGAAQMVGEIAAKRLDGALAIVPSVAAMVSAGQLKALGVAGARRAPQLPATPSMAEQGLDGVEAESWLGLFARASVPVADVAAMTDHVAAVLRAPEVVQQVERLGLSVSLRDAAALATFQRREIERWRSVIEATGLRPE